MPSHSRAPVQKRSRASADRALAAATDVIADTGWSGFRLAAVSERANTSIGLLTSRFGGKEGLFTAAQQVAVGRILAGAERMLAPAATAQEAIGHAVGGLAETFEHLGPLLRGITIGLPPGTRAAAIGTEANWGLARAFHQALLAHRDEITHPDPEIAVDVCFRTLFGDLDRRTLYGPTFESRPDLPWRELLSEEEAAFRAYLLAPPRPGTAAHPRFAASAAAALPHGAVDAEPVERVFAAGIELLSEDAAREPTIADVARRAGISVGAVYNHFDSKDALFLALNDRAQSYLADELRGAFAPAHWADVTDPDELVASAVSTLAAHSWAHPDFLRATVLRAEVDPRVATAGAQTVVELSQRFCQTLLRARAAITRPDPDVAVEVCFRLAFSVAVKRVAMGPVFESPTELTDDRLVHELGSLERAYLLGR